MKSHFNLNNYCSKVHSDLTANIVNILGATTSLKKETPTKSADAVPPLMESTKESNSAMKQAKVQTQIQKTISQLYIV